MTTAWILVTLALILVIASVTILVKLTDYAKLKYTYRCTECNVIVKSNLEYFIRQAETTHKHHKI